MGWYITYEIDFVQAIDWDDDYIKNAIHDEDIDAQVLFLRDYDFSRCICVLYTHYNIKQVLEILWKKYKVPMTFGKYNSSDKELYTCANHGFTKID
jgi:hypothetical protein